MTEPTLLKTNEFISTIRSDATATIANGQTVSDVADLHGTTLIATLTESALTLATSISFESSIDNINFFPVDDASGVQISVQVNQNRVATFSPIDFSFSRYVKVVLNTTEPVDVVFALISKP